jgi:hypothetical protein
VPKANSWGVRRRRRLEADRCEGNVVFWRRFEKLQRPATELRDGDGCTYWHAACTKWLEGGFSMDPGKRDGGPQRQPEVPVIDDPQPAEPKVPDLPPPVADPPEVIARGASEHL